MKVCLTFLELQISVIFPKIDKAIISFLAICCESNGRAIRIIASDGLGISVAAGQQNQHGLLKSDLLMNNCLLYIKIWFVVYSRCGAPTRVAARCPIAQSLVCRSRCILVDADGALVKMRLLNLTVCMHFPIGYFMHHICVRYAVAGIKRTRVNVDLVCYSVAQACVVVTWPWHHSRPIPVLPNPILWSLTFARRP